jgi:hypothetical protein
MFNSNSVARPRAVRPEKGRYGIMAAAFVPASALPFGTGLPNTLCNFSAFSQFSF